MVHYIEYSALAPIAKDYVICDKADQTEASTLELLLNTLDTDKDAYISAQEWNDALHNNTITNLIDVGCYADFTAHVNHLFNPACSTPPILADSVSKIPKIQNVFPRDEVLTDLISKNSTLENRAINNLIEYSHLYHEYYATPAIEKALKSIMYGQQASNVLEVFKKTDTFLLADDIRPFFATNCFGLSFKYSQDIRDKALERLDPTHPETEAFLHEIESTNKKAETKPVTVIFVIGDDTYSSISKTSLAMLIDTFKNPSTPESTRIKIKALVQNKIAEDSESFIEELGSLLPDAHENVFNLFFDENNPTSFPIALEYAQDANDYAALVTAGYPQAEAVYKNKFADSEQYKLDILFVLMGQESIKRESLKVSLFKLYSSPDGIAYDKGVEILEALVQAGHKEAIDAYYRLATDHYRLHDYKYIPPIMMSLAKAGHEPAIHYLVEMLVDGSLTEFSRLDIATLLTGCKISDCEKERLFPILLQEPKIIREKLYQILAS